MSRSDTGDSAAALRAAANVGNVAACQYYLRSCRSVQFSHDSEGRTALHLAAIGGHIAVIRFLLTVAAPNEVNSTDGGGYTPLQIAAAEGHEEIIKLLLAQGADVNANDNVHGNSPLHEASWKGYSRSINVLVAGRANLNKLNYGGFTALHLCCQKGHNQTCRELLLAGSSPDSQNSYGDTSLHTAARYGHAGVSRILISAQCKISVENKNGDTALHIAAAMGRRKLTRILLEAGCDKDARNKQNETPKDIALRKNLSEVFFIIDHFNCTQNSKMRTKKVRKYSREGKSHKDISYNVEKNNWSPYGCHYFPDPEFFPCPRLDSLPQEPLKHGEQYYLDLAGNICKGPVGVGYTCYCAPFFKHLKIRMERDKREFQRAQVKLDQRVSNLEHLLQRSHHVGISDDNKTIKKRKCSLSRCRSLELLDTLNKPMMQAARSMDDVDQSDEMDGNPTNLNMVHAHADNNNSESSDEETQCLKKDTKDINAILSYSSVSNCDIGVFSTSALPRHRGGVYSPTSNDAIDKHRYMENILIVEDSNMIHPKFPNTEHSSGCDYRFQPEMKCRDFPYLQNFVTQPNSSKYEQNLTSRLAKLRVLDNSKTVVNNSVKTDARDAVMHSNFVTSQLQDSVDRDTNNDSGYSTKVYGSSKGNSPNLCGQIDSDCLGASSLV